jgi:hypothetical protein
VASPRVLAWGAIGGVAGGVLLVVGSFLAVLPARDAIIVTGTWFVLLGILGLLFAGIGLHEMLAATDVSLAGIGAVLTMFGSALLVAVQYAALASAYDLVTEPIYLAAELIGVPAAGGVALVLGILLLGIAMLREVTAPTIAGAAFVVAAVAFPLGLASTPAFYVGGVLLGMGTAWTGALLWRTRAERLRASIG